MLPILIETAWCGVTRQLLPRYIIRVPSKLPFKATAERAKSVKRPPVITFERPKLIYSLLAPPVLSSERPNLEVRDVPIRPEKRISDPFSFYLKINKLKFEVKNFEDLKCSGWFSKLLKFERVR